jgi:HAE1 family hydrophobic/amphiphilic exporter-1
MNISVIFIKRPVMTSLLMLCLVLMSLMAYKALPVSALPKIEFPVIQVTANLSGASPETMAKAVSMPLEQGFSAIAGLDTMTSVNAQGVTRITLQFGLETDLNTVSQDVNTAISTAQSSLPNTMTNLPTFKKLNPSEQPIIILTMNSDSIPIWKLNQYADNFVVNRLSMLPGVAQVDVIGKQKYAVRIYAKPEMLKARGLGLDLVATNIAQANVNSTSGILQGTSQAMMINTNSLLKNAKDFQEILINQSDNLRLKDIATVVDDVDNLYSAAWYNGKRSVVLAVSRQPGSNAIELADNIKNALPEIREQLPKSLNMEVIIDRTLSIRDSIKEVNFTAILSIVLVVLVIFLFLRNLQATLIPALSIPMSIILSFSVMYYLGFTINNLTLMALTLSIGFVIDDAIVVLENIMVKREHGASAIDAAISGSKEISFTVISMTMSLVAAFIPVLFMPGIVGRLLNEFAVTITASILASGFISLTLIPTLSQYLSEKHEEIQNPALEKFKHYYEKIAAIYAISLEKMFKFQKQIVWFITTILFVNIALYMMIPKGFFPNEDTGLIYGVSEVLPETSFETMKKSSSKLMEVLKNEPSIESFNCSIGASTTTVASNEGRFFIRLKQLSQREFIDKIMNRLRKNLAKISDIKTSIQVVQNLRVSASLSKSQYQYTLRSQDFTELAEIANTMETKLAKTAGFTDVNSDLKLNSVQVDIQINRDRLARFGLSIQKVTDALSYAYADRQVSTIYTEADTYQVILGLEKEEAQTIQDLSQLYVRNDNNELISLSTVATFERRNAPLTVNHLNRLAAATISFNLTPDNSLSTAIETIKNIEKTSNFPTTVTSTFQGTAQAFQKSQSGGLLLIIFTIVTIYIILGILYESYRHPITILTGLPSAGTGALIFLWLFGFDLDVIGIIGIVLLIGIVKKNAIMMIDYAIEKQRSSTKMSAKQAITEACARRFRPIMMTTFAAIMGALPIAFWQGSGAELRQPLGICIISGLLVSQWLTLYITPLFYVWIESKRKPS